MIPYLILLSHVFLLILLDRFVFNRSQTKKPLKAATGEPLFFIFNAFIFSGLIYLLYDGGYANNINQITSGQAVIKFITGYLIELSLSVDNLFVIAVLFASYKVPSNQQHRLLFYGIMGAVVFRAVLIILGLELINRFESMSIVFGLFLLYTAIKVLTDKDTQTEEFDTNKGIGKVLNFSPQIETQGRYFTKEKGKLVFTNLFACLIAIEFTDLLFALDSIPAIFAVTTDPFIVYSSNIFAIMGLRSMYYFLKDMLDRFEYLKYSIFAILLFVGIKLIISSWVHIPELISLAYIFFALAGGVLYSLRSSP